MFKGTVTKIIFEPKTDEPSLSNLFKLHQGQNSQEGLFEPTPLF